MLTGADTIALQAGPPREPGVTGREHVRPVLNLGSPFCDWELVFSLWYTRTNESTNPIQHRRVDGSWVRHILGRSATGSLRGQWPALRGDRHGQCSTSILLFVTGSDCLVRVPISFKDTTLNVSLFLSHTGPATPRKVSGQRPLGMLRHVRTGSQPTCPRKARRGRWALRVGN